jgi:hypothetical protein
MPICSQADHSSSTSSLLVLISPPPSSSTKGREDCRGGSTSTSKLTTSPQLYVWYFDALQFVLQVRIRALYTLLHLSARLLALQFERDASMFLDELVHIYHCPLPLKSDLKTNQHIGSVNVHTLGDACDPKWFPVAWSTNTWLRRAKLLPKLQIGFIEKIETLWQTINKLFYWLAMVFRGHFSSSFDLNH